MQRKIILIRPCFVLITKWHWFPLKTEQKKNSFRKLGVVCNPFHLNLNFLKIFLFFLQKFLIGHRWPIHDVMGLGFGRAPWLYSILATTLTGFLEDPVLPMKMKRIACYMVAIHFLLIGVTLIVLPHWPMPFAKHILKLIKYNYHNKWKMLLFIMLIKTMRNTWSCQSESSPKFSDVETGNQKMFLVRTIIARNFKCPNIGDLMLYVSSNKYARAG